MHHFSDGAPPVHLPVAHHGHSLHALECNHTPLYEMTTALSPPPLSQKGFLASLVHKQKFLTAAVMCLMALNWLP